MRSREAKVSMRISATGNRLTRDAGVSLVEVLTALAVIAMMAGMVVVMAPGPERQARSLAERVAARAIAASEESVLTNRPIALVVNDAGYGFERFEEGGWRPLDPASPFGFRAWPDDVRATSAGAVRFEPTGGASPGVVTIAARASAWRVSVDEGGRAHVARAD